MQFLRRWGGGAEKYGEKAEKRHEIELCKLNCVSNTLQTHIALHLMNTKFTLIVIAQLLSNTNAANDIIRQSA